LPPKKPKKTFEQTYRFNLFMLKAVLDGRATELVDLARTNLIRREPGHYQDEKRRDTVKVTQSRAASRTRWRSCSRRAG
jgi:hypothetical protein